MLYIYKLFNIIKEGSNKGGGGKNFCSPGQFI